MWAQQLWPKVLELQLQHHSFQRQSSDSPSWYFQPHEGSQDLLSGDLGSWWGLETWWGLEICIPGEVCSGSVILGRSLSFCSRFFCRSLEMRGVQVFDVVASSLWTPPPCFVNGIPSVDSWHYLSWGFGHLAVSRGIFSYHYLGHLVAEGQGCC